MGRSPLLSSDPKQMIITITILYGSVLGPLFLSILTLNGLWFIISGVVPPIYVLYLYISAYRTKIRILASILERRFLTGDIRSTVLSYEDPFPFYMGFRSLHEVSISDERLFMYLSGIEFDEDREIFETDFSEENDVASFTAATSVSQQNPFVQKYRDNLRLISEYQIGLYDCIVEKYNEQMMNVGTDEEPSLVEAMPTINEELGIKKSAMSQVRILEEYLAPYPELLERMQEIRDQTPGNWQIEQVVDFTTKSEKGEKLKKWVYGGFGLWLLTIFILYGSIFANTLSGDVLGVLGTVLTGGGGFYSISKQKGLLNNLESKIHVLQFVPAQEEALKQLARIKAYYGHNAIRRIHIYEVEVDSHSGLPWGGENESPFKCIIITPAPFDTAFMFHTYEYVVDREWAPILGSEVTLIHDRDLPGGEPVFWAVRCSVEMTWMLNVLQIPEVVGNIVNKILLHKVSRIRSQLEAERASRSAYETFSKELLKFIYKMASRNEEISEMIDRGDLPELLVRGPQMKMIRDEQMRWRKIAIFGSVALIISWMIMGAFLIGSRV